MFKKMLPWVIVLLIAITLIALAAFILWDYIMEDSPQNAADKAQEVELVKLSAEEIMSLTVTLDDITTNLADMNYVVRLSFALQAENEKTKEELDKIKHLVEAKIIRTLADTTPDEIMGSKGFDSLSSKLINLINPLLSNGKIQQIEITDFIISKM